jgi:hypothetical protein
MPASKLARRQRGQTICDLVSRQADRFARELTCLVAHLGITMIFIERQRMTLEFLKPEGGVNDSLLL